MNEQRSNETVCVEALCKQRCGTHMRVGDYGLYTCRAGALPGTEQELGRTFGNRGWTAEGSRRWRPGPPGSTGSGGIRVRCSTRLGYSRAAGDCGGGTAWWGEEIQHRKLAGLCGVAGWVVESGEARLQSLAGGEEI